MKSALFASTLVLGLGVAQAEAAPIRYFGGLILTTATAACANSNDAVGDRYNAGFRPAGIGTNGTDSSLTLFTPHFAIGLKVAGGSFGTTAKTVQTDYISDGGFGGGVNATTVRFTKQTQSSAAQVDQTALSAATYFIEITGTITGFDDTAGCNVNFTASLQKRQ